MTHMTSMSENKAEWPLLTNVGVPHKQSSHTIRMQKHMGAELTAQGNASCSVNQGNFCC